MSIQNGTSESGSINSSDNAIQLPPQNYQQSQYVSTANHGLLQQEQSQQITVSNHNWASMRSSVIEMESLALHLRLGHNYEIRALQDSENSQYNIMVVRKDSDYKSIHNTSESTLQLSNAISTKLGSITEKPDHSIVNEEMAAVSNLPENYSVDNGIDITQQPLICEEAIAVSAVQEDYALNPQADFLPEAEISNAKQDPTPKANSNYGNLSQIVLNSQS